MVWLLALLLIASDAWALARLTIQASGAWTVILDAQAVWTAGSMGPVTLSGLSPGSHRLQVRDAAGLVVYDAQVEVADGASATARWDGRAMSLVGLRELRAVTVDGQSPFRAEGDRPVDPDTAALERLNAGEAQDQLASQNGQRPVQDSHAVGGSIPTEVTDLAGGALQSGLGLSPSTGTLITGAASSFSYMVNTAEAGGLRRRYSPDARQGDPNVPPPVLEEVQLVNLGGKPMSVYVEGMWLHDFAAGETRKSVQIEVGSRPMQFVDPARRQVVHQGTLRIKDGYVLILEFSPTQAPRASNANWAWAPE